MPAAAATNFCFSEWINEDLTYAFIHAVQAAFPLKAPKAEAPPEAGALEEVEAVRRAFGIRDINLVKPGIGEATRVLLRRLPWKMLVHSKNDGAHLGHLYQLASEKGVPLVEYPLRHYRACGLIQELADT